MCALLAAGYHIFPEATHWVSTCGGSRLVRTLAADIASAVIDVPSSEDHTRPQLLKVVSAVAQNGASGP